MRPLLPDAACRTPDGEALFAHLNKARVQEAKRICAGCADRAACLEWALKHERWGVWAGLTGDGLKALRLYRGIALEELTAGYNATALPSAEHSAPDTEQKAVRAWARQTGRPVPYRGRVAADVVAEYRESVGADA
jgi:hypothetical protein